MIVWVTLAIAFMVQGGKTKQVEVRNADAYTLPHQTRTFRQGKLTCCRRRFIYINGRCQPSNLLCLGKRKTRNATFQG